MTTEMIDGVPHTYAPNPVMRGDDWATEYPSITSNTKFLRNKYTGEIVPNFPEFAERSDVYEPYAGDPFAEKDSHPAVSTVDDSGSLASL